MLSSGALVLTILFLLGFLLAQYFSDVALKDLMPSTNNGYLIIWRCVLYCVFIGYWKQILHFAARLRGLETNEKRLNRLIENRKLIIIICAGFEIFIVQNVLSHLVKFVFNSL